MKIAVLTTGRQDWGMLRPLCEDLFNDPFFELLIIAGGMACDHRYSFIAKEIESLSLPLSCCLVWDLEAAPSVQAASALAQTARVLDEQKPDALILLGDRYETCAAAFAATLKRVPIIHLYGGEETEGAFDNVFRHAISKMSHLHFVANDIYARRLVAMGEGPSSVHTVGLLSLDLVAAKLLPERAALESDLGVKLKAPVFLVTLHPTTLGSGPGEEISALGEAMKGYPATWIVTLPNADPGGSNIRASWESLKSEIPGLFCFSALGETRYLALLRLASLVIGNSSSGLTEAPFFGVPTVNIGDRQKGRLRSASVIDVTPAAGDITAAIKRAMSREFREKLAGMEPVYGRGDASRRILEIIKKWQVPLNCRKPFYESH